MNPVVVALIRVLYFIIGGLFIELGHQAGRFAVTDFQIREWGSAIACALIAGFLFGFGFLFMAAVWVFWPWPMGGQP